MPVAPTGAPKQRKPRPSRARGLRTTTGCLTCRKRRVKCDESKPRCGQCIKSERSCSYGSAIDTNSEQTADQEESSPRESNAPTAQPSSATVCSPARRIPSIAGEIDVFQNSPELRFDLSPLTIATSLPSPNSAPFEWYDLLAEDAINNIQKHNLGFETTCLSRRQSPVPETPAIDPQLQSPKEDHIHAEPTSTEPWNSVQTIQLTGDEIQLFQHFVDVLGPALDLFDHLRHFTILVPRLAVHNLGVLKSLLAVAARHMELHADTQPRQSFSAATPGSSVSGSHEAQGPAQQLSDLATQYYYETLHYLSQNLLYPSYTKSGEIIATAILISTYEMFDARGSNGNGNWERHLRGIFWIQRSQNNNGESVDGLRRAAWWAWLRQDIWVAFRENRRTLTIWRPTKRLMDLTPDELALRIVYIAARCVDYAANEKQYDMHTRIEQGDTLLNALEDWHRVLPASFNPIYTQDHSENSSFSPIWIHPPAYAAAVQVFHFARIVVIINQPTMGGMNPFRRRRRYLDESVEAICGIATMHQRKDIPSSFVDMMCVYAAGHCVQTPTKQGAVLQLLERCLDITKFPPRSLLDDLAKYWREET
ncbi:hypothetical protein EJ04DRAFT_546167 [Polyplosphaeria fusca]|uniref:Zn(2)-C6 fungal-type domain-containing protein n=1 Tax=Polyplosphaeria fusca TaxID=682080 RepID=A0A9P4UZ02_9PLEO|nr:hypothetical protein EJ04DRAFT_546167 [Polyplosphaeria fusca]